MVTMLRGGENESAFDESKNNNRKDKSKSVGAVRRVSGRDCRWVLQHVLGLLIAAPAVLLMLAASAVLAQTTPGAAHVKIKVGQIGAVSDAGIFIAEEKGFFKSEGLDVELVTFKAAP